MALAGSACPCASQDMSGWRDWLQYVLDANGDTLHNSHSLGVVPPRQPTPQPPPSLNSH
ncbi:hypothetical protein [Psychrobacter lutiphocae]|uniref:hypothetical protein n=1 Tax=Psychrobacter lutiphocae TaxID=540500 RepID=UPI0003A3A5EC|nr:hypothetical protein [Psychrobacter lutiphocae]